MFQQLWLFNILTKGNLSEASIINFKYVTMRGLQDFYQDSSFTDLFQKQNPSDPDDENKHFNQQHIAIE